MFKVKGMNIKNTELEELISQFIETQSDNDTGECCISSKEMSEQVMEGFKDFLKLKGKRIK